jgi:uncharacterized protein
MQSSTSPVAMHSLGGRQPLEQAPADSPAGNEGDLREPRQYSRLGTLAVWAAATVPMGVLSWLVAPAVAGPGASERRFVVTLVIAMTCGLVWQAVLTAILVMRERPSSWRTLRERLWLRPPSTATRRGGRLWLWVPVYALGLAVLDIVIQPLIFPDAPDSRNMGAFLSSPVGQQTFHHGWGLFALLVVMQLFNTVLGEEMLFRGFLLPRMRGSFGRADWVVNGVLFGLYHLHEPWVIPNAIITGFLCAQPTRRFRSAWMGIAIHSIESVFFVAVVLPVVLS